MMDIACIVVSQPSKDIYGKLAENGLPLENGEKVENLLEAVLEDEELVGVAELGQTWVLLSEPGRFFEEGFSGFLSMLSENAKVFMLLSQNVTGGLWFEYHVKGAMQRQWVLIEGEVQSNEGSPLNDRDQTAFFKYDEDSEFWDAVLLMEEVMGVRWQDLEKAGSVYRVE